MIVARIEHAWQLYAIGVLTYEDAMKYANAKETTMGDEAEKELARVEVGQRWRLNDACGCEGVAGEGPWGSDPRMTLLLRPVKCRLGNSTHEAISREATFLGWVPGYGPQPPTCGATSETYPTHPCVLTDRHSTHQTSGGYRWHIDARKANPFEKAVIKTDASAVEKYMAEVAKAIVAKKEAMTLSPPSFDPNKVCGAHGQPQFLLGQVLPCPNPGCGNGARGECHDMPIAGRDGYARVLFQRDYLHLTEDTGLWRWKAMPSVTADDSAMAAKLRTDGWGSAIIDAPPKVVTKPVKPGTMAIPASLSKVPPEYRNSGIKAWLPIDSFYGGVDRDVAMQKLASEYAKPTKPQRREVSVDGRNWLDYERLHDPDAFEVYPWRKVDGQIDPLCLMVKKHTAVGFYGLASGGEIACAAPRSEYVRAKRKPWQPAVDDVDLLPDVTP
jgi:hypothetical protein